MGFYRSRFEDLALFVANENRPHDQGLEIHPGTEAAYLEMLVNIYDPLTHDCYEGDKRGRLNSVRNFVTDIPRTVYMMRAMFRAIQVLEQEKTGPIVVSEAGCGSGFLAAAALALSPRTVVKGFDQEQERVEVSKHFAEALGYGNRTVFEQCDLTHSGKPLQTDVLIAEHLTRGLQMEKAAQIPRRFEVNPDFVIPYSARPATMWGIKLNIWEGFDGEQPTVLFERPRHGVEVDYGKEVVLGDPSHPDYFEVRGVRAIPLGFTPVLVANDIGWASPRFKGASLYQSIETYRPNPTKITAWDNHLMGPALLEAVRKRSEVYYGFIRLDGEDEPADYEIRYPFGALCADPRINPEVSTNDPLAEVHVGPSGDFCYNNILAKLVSK